MRLDQAVQRYSDMLRSAVDWLWETDKQLNLSYISPSIAGALGYPAQVLTGRHLLELAHANSEAAMAEPNPMTAAIAARRAFRSEHFQMIAREGHRVGFFLSGMPFFDKSGRFAGYRGTGTAVPRQVKQTADDSQVTSQLMDVLEAALERKDQLEWELSESGHQSFQTRLVAIAHELRTPLNAIIGFAEVIRDRVVGDDLDRYVEYGSDIHDSGVYLLELINGILDMAQVEAVRLRRRREWLSLAEIANAAFRMLGERAAAAEVKLVIDLPPDLPKVWSERRALRQILLNLLSNAIKYTPHGGTAGIEAEVVGAEALNLVVWDTGIGVPAAEQEKVFTLTYRVAQDNLAAEKPGSGLGLAISRDLARALGGDISLKSQPGHGSRFTLSLPLQPPNSADLE